MKGAQEAQGPAAPEDAGRASTDVVSSRRELQPLHAFPELDREIVGEFVTEGNERLAEADARLLELEKQPSHSEALNAVFRAFHTIKGLAGFLNLNDLQNTAHAAEDLLDQARSGRLQLSGLAIDLVFQATDVLRQLIRQIADCLASDSWPPAGLARAPALVESIRSLLAAGATPAAAAKTASPREEPVELAQEPMRSAESAETLRVDAQRLDQLVDLVGELVITESMVSRASGLGDAGARDVRRHVLRLDKITRELQELTSSLRMVPVQSLFRKMARLARDTAKKCDKLVVFETTGEDTELDKSLVERIADPLVHMVRNAIDHGLESTSSERVQRGKTSAGRVDLRAFHRGGNIHIEVEDDGRGLDRAKIFAKAVQRGLLRSDEQPEDRELFALICQPGFSTAAQVTALSGRGVGMDVVKRNIRAMGGSLEIRSEEGRGTCFAMKLPLTLAVIDGMLVRAGTERYIIPTLSVLRLVEPKAADISSVLESQQLLAVQGQRLPLLRLSTLFGSPGRSDCRLAVVVEADNERLAILVDELFGQQQAVIKSIGHGLGETPGVSGCAILSDGRVGLVIDIAGLLQLARTGASPAAGAAKQHEPPRGGWTV